MATATKTTKGFRMTCPVCSETGDIWLNVTDTSKLRCGACDNEITADEVKAIIAGWSRLLQWLDTAPDAD